MIIAPLDWLNTMAKEEELKRASEWISQVDSLAQLLTDQDYKTLMAAKDKMQTNSSNIRAITVSTPIQ